MKKATTTEVRQIALLNETDEQFDYVDVDDASCNDGQKVNFTQAFEKFDKFGSSSGISGGEGNQLNQYSSHGSPNKFSKIQAPPSLQKYSHSVLTNQNNEMHTSPVLSKISIKEKINFNVSGGFPGTEEKSTHDK